MERQQLQTGLALQFVLPLDVVCESCSICNGTGRWVDRRGVSLHCWCCNGIGSVAYDSFDLVQS